MSKLSDDLYEQVIDCAGYGIAYWATRAEEGELGGVQTYTVDTQEGETKTVTREGISHAFNKLARGGVISTQLTEYMARALKDDRNGDADIDSAVADCVIQYAIFGEIVYG